MRTPMQDMRVHSAQFAIGNMKRVRNRIQTEAFFYGHGIQIERVARLSISRIEIVLVFCCNKCGDEFGNVMHGFAGER